MTRMTAAEQAAAMGVSAGRGWELDLKDGGRLQFYSGQQQASGGTGGARISALPWVRGLLSHVDLTLMLLYATPLQPRICLRRVVAFYAAILDVSYRIHSHTGTSRPGRKGRTTCARFKPLKINALVWFRCSDFKC